ncbi:hypothetical protein [Paracidovorax avenae]|uniref:hypothetical protein n=1 Tax=Paracidovorax avenae TaxID=80867 RepID=UPI001AD7F215|nr:hypothetical protein [Paracidovorax avenae]
MIDESIKKENRGYILDFPVLRDGDVILISGQKAHSLVIRSVTKSHYSHAMIFLEGTIFEATLDGSVFTRVPNRFYVESQSDMKVLRFNEPLSHKDVQAIVGFARDNVMTSYSITEAIRSSKKNKPTTKREMGQFCSRYVAECYFAAGLRIAKNIYYCTPADLEKAPEFSEVINAVRLGTSEEILHASSGELHPKHQKATVLWVKGAKKILQAAGYKAQTISQINQAIIDLRSADIDKRIAKLIRASGYLDNVHEDRKANPYRYDASIFADFLRGGQIEIGVEIAKDRPLFKLHLNNHRINRINIVNTNDLYKVFRLHQQVYQSNLSMIGERMQTIIEASAMSGLCSHLVEEAVQMNSEIQKELSR